MAIFTKRNALVGSLALMVGKLYARRKVRRFSARSRWLAR